MGGRKSFFGIILVCLLAICMGCTTAIADGQPAKMEIYGKISVKGSEPHTYLCLSTESGADYRLEGELKDLIWARYQQERIRLEGVVTKAAIGPGFPAVFLVRRIMSP